MKPLTLKELTDEFEFLGDWDSQCDYLIDLGFELPKLEDQYKTEDYIVHGCQSQVWLVPDVTQDEPPIINFRAESDALIVSGLIAVLHAVYSGKTAKEVLETDIHAVFSQLGLDRHLSPQRRNGLFGMVKRIQSLAAKSLSN